MIQRVERAGLHQEIAVNVIREACWKNCAVAHSVILGVSENLRMKGRLRINGEPNIKEAEKLYGDAILKSCSVIEGFNVDCMPGNGPSVADLHKFQ